MRFGKVRVVNQTKAKQSVGEQLLAPHLADTDMDHNEHMCIFFLPSGCNICTAEQILPPPGIYQTHKRPTRMQYYAKERSAAVLKQ
jgi:hypothetical protein